MRTGTPIQRGDEDEEVEEEVDEDDDHGHDDDDNDDDYGEGNKGEFDEREEWKDCQTARHEP